MKPCSICSHPQRELIDKLLVNGSTLKEIEDAYGLSKSAISRHRAEHISITSPAVGMKPEIIASSDSLLDQLQDIHQRTLSILASAEQSGREETALKAIGRATANIELMAKISVVLADRLKDAKGAQDTKVVFVNLVSPDGKTCSDVRVEQFRAYVQDREKRGLSTDAATWSNEDILDLVHDLYSPLPDMPRLASVSEHIAVYLPHNGREPLPGKPVEEMTDNELHQMLTWGKVRPGEETVIPEQCFDNLKLTQSGGEEASIQTSSGARASPPNNVTLTQTGEGVDTKASFIATSSPGPSPVDRPVTRPRPPGVYR